MRQAPGEDGSVSSCLEPHIRRDRQAARAVGVLGPGGGLRPAQLQGPTSPQDAGVSGGMCCEGAPAAPLRVASTTAEMGSIAAVGRCPPRSVSCQLLSSFSRLVASQACVRMAFASGRFAGSCGGRERTRSPQDSFSVDEPPTRSCDSDL